jgi:hypothetical protein
MAPANKPEERMKEVRVIRTDPKSPLWPDTFEYCRDMCRTHAWSTSHENAYISPRHHCFSRLGKPLVRTRLEHRRAPAVITLGLHVITGPLFVLWIV